jgi:hypothetical protein
MFPWVPVSGNLEASTNMEAPGIIPAVVRAFAVQLEQAVLQGRAWPRRHAWSNAVRYHTNCSSGYTLCANQVGCCPSGAACLGTTSCSFSITPTGDGQSLPPITGQPTRLPPMTGIVFTPLSSFATKIRFDSWYTAAILLFATHWIWNTCLIRDGF